MTALNVRSLAFVVRRLGNLLPKPIDDAPGAVEPSAEDVRPVSC